jgi:hypothetical protein
MGERNGAPGGTRTPDLLVRRENLRYTPYNSNRKEPMKSTGRVKTFRMVSAAIGHRSRTITRTISTHQALSPFGQLRLLVEASTSRPRSLSGFRRGPREGWEAKVVSAPPAEHDSVGRLLESRCAAATSEVYEALRERPGRSVEDADVIERKGLAGFAAPFDSYLGVAVHDKLGNSHSLLYSQSGRFGGKSTGVLPEGPGPGLCHEAGHIQPFPTARRTSFAHPRNRAKCVKFDTFMSRITPIRVLSTSDCLPNVPLQVAYFVEVASTVRVSVSVLESGKHAN